MDRARKAWLAYMNARWPPIGMPPAMTKIDAIECMRIVYEFAPTIATIAEVRSTRIRFDDRIEVDRFLETWAEGGESGDLIAGLSIAALAELNLRIEWALVALALEAGEQTYFAVECPQIWSEKLRSELVLVCVLAGPSRDYPEKWRDELRRGKRRS